MRYRLSTLIITATLFALCLSSGVLSFFSNQLLDTLFLLRGPVTPQQAIIIIGVDEASLKALGSWPFARKYHAQLLAKLNKAKVIGFDVLFNEITKQDDLFDKAMQSAPPVLLAIAHNVQHQILQPAPSLHHYFGAGHIEVVLPRDGVIRRIMPFQQIEDRSFPTLSLAMLEAAGKPDTEIAADKPMLLNHYGPENTFLHLSYIDVLRGNIPEDFFANRFVLIGAKALGIGDVHVTPFSQQHETSGVEIQATIFSNLLDHSWLKPLPQVSWIAIAFIVLANFFIWPKQSEKCNLFVNLSFAALLISCSLLLFRWSLFFDSTQPLLFLLLCYPLYLFTGWLWTLKTIFKEMNRLDQLLVVGLEKVYTNIPSQFFNLQPRSTTGGIRNHIAHMQDAVKVLSLQHHFIENLLIRDLPPLILWDKNSGQVIIANSMFKTFWSSCFPEYSTIPDFDLFLRRVQSDQPGEPDVQADSILFADTNTPTVLDFKTSTQGTNKFFRISIHPVVAAELEFKGILVLLTDVTASKELEQLKDEIVSVTSHMN